MPIVTITRALRPFSSVFGMRLPPPAANAKPGRRTCSKKALSAAGMSPSHSG